MFSPLAALVLFDALCAEGSPHRPGTPDYGLKRTDRVLYQPAQPAGRDLIEHPEFNALIRAMELSAEAWHGYALAAPQVGMPVRLVVMTQHQRLRAALLIGDGTQRVDWTKLPAVPRVLINPSVEAIGTATAQQEEGCLSFPGQGRFVTRPASVRLRYLDETWTERTLDCHRLLARVVQHEVDHLDGITIFPKPAPSEEKRIKHVSFRALS